MAVFEVFEYVYTFFSTMTNISTSVKTILFTPAILAFGGLNLEADRQY